VNFDFLAWNKLDGMIISPQNVALLYLVVVFSQFVLLLNEMRQMNLFGPFFIEYIRFSAKKFLELICSTRLSSIPGSATATRHHTTYRPRRDDDGGRANLSLRCQSMILLIPLRPSQRRTQAPPA
jgi:hypothetical protein